MNQQELGKDLLHQLMLGYDVVKISRWAYRTYSDNCRTLDSKMIEILEILFSMEDDPQFEYTEQELRLLAENLIANSEDPLKEVRKMKRPN